MGTGRFFALVWLAGSLPAQAGVETFISVDPAGANTVAFEPVQTRFIRFVVLRSSRSQPCIDELEVYGPGSHDNLALASAGAKATASSCLAGYPAHAVDHLNDGKYGNQRSWACGAPIARIGP